MNDNFLILGGGFTGQRVARRLLSQGARVFVTARQSHSLSELTDQGATVLELDLTRPETLASLSDLPESLRVLHSVPTVGDPPADPTPALLAALGNKPSRVVYISTTGVYGDTQDADETTPANPQTASQKLRVEAERQVLAGKWAGLVLRPAGIYGPGRGVHQSIRIGRYRLVGDGSNYQSRIHVDDLTAHCVAALLSDEVQGAYPVGDELPCPAREIAAFCAELLGLPLPPSIPYEQAHETSRANRRVKGRAIRQKLALELKYPTYREGIPACLAEEAATDQLL